MNANSATNHSAQVVQTQGISKPTDRLGKTPPTESHFVQTAPHRKKIEMSFPNANNPADDLQEFLVEMFETFHGLARHKLSDGDAAYVVATYRHAGLAYSAREIDIEANPCNEELYGPSDNRTLYPQPES